MSGWAGLAVLCLAAATALALSCALSVAVVFARLEPLLQRWAMAGRLRTLVALAVLPVVIASSLLAICFGPSLLAATGVVPDHCFRHIDHHIHLCIRHLPNVAPSAAIAALAAFGVAGIALVVGRVLRLTMRGRRAERSLASMSSHRDGVRWLESPVAVSLTGGLLRPRVYLSSGMAACLDERELAAAVAHEQCHAREHHGLWKLLATAGSLHLPAMHQRLMAMVDLACERRADEAAATRVGSRLHIASAILRAQRLAPVLDPANALLLALGKPGHHLTLRVHALLDEAAVEPPPPTARWAWIAASALLAASHEIHHGVEHALSLLV